jgi:hypothetical protein
VAAPGQLGAEGQHGEGMAGLSEGAQEHPQGPAHRSGGAAEDTRDGRAPMKKSIWIL